MPAVDEGVQDYKLDLAHKIFLWKAHDAPGVDKAQTQKEILAVIDRDALAPLYQHLCTELGWPLDVAKLESYKAQNAARITELEEKITDAQENLGETEVRDALAAKADYLASLCDREGAVAAYKATEEKTSGGGNKVDLVFSQIRLFILYEDWKAVKQQVDKAKQLCADGGDWERKNKLKVYEAILALYLRDFKLAADLFLDSTATFTTTELFPYTRVILYAVIASMISLDRVALKKRVVDAPEILTVIDTIPHLSTLLHSLYYCKYSQFFKSFVEIVDAMKLDLYLAPHVRYYMRELRVVAYSQFLESYKSVTLDSMASAFDVSINFLDTELADFIVAGRLHAKIDKVAGVVETNRPDAKNALYQESIKKGDLLLNRIQKLSKIIDIE